LTAIIIGLPPYNAFVNAQFVAAVSDPDLASALGSTLSSLFPIFPKLKNDVGAFARFATHILREIISAAPK
jgi:hypothetical protein